ncbi:MAG: nucleotide sugar dehydrogenase [Myxococcales bacterium]|nr:nucleotide sugar dehydrogenase [Myxococcales bacterium]
MGGCGHVGLPLGLALANAGQKVIAFDINAEKVESTNQGRMPFRDQGADELLKEVLAQERFLCTTERECLKDVEVIISVTGTPVDEHLNPRLDDIQQALLSCAEMFNSKQLLVLRSTIYPGTTKHIEEELQRRGLAMDVAFCPERVAEGYALEEIRSLPQIVSGCSRQAEDRAAKLFALLTQDIVRLDPLSAELAKLFTNTWRYVQFAVSNQFFTMANDYGADFYAIHEAMTHNYKRTQGFPTAGFAAGPCLLKDTMQLSAFHKNNFFLGHAAMLVNEGLPNYLVGRLQEKFDLSKMCVGLLGMTFKADSDDIRDSLSFKLRRQLKNSCGQLLCHDPYLDDDWLSPLDEVLERSDILVVGAPHNVYKELDWPDKNIVDVWNISPKRMKIL